MEAIKSETKYERLRKIGIGSYGVVFKCVNRQTGQIVAIKRYSENDTDPIIRKIAMREVRMLRQLKHPNLINLIEVFRRKRILHLVFDYCELTVLDVIEKYANNCPLNLIKKIIWQLVNGVSHCHTLNCIHRDIKPENILINQAGVVKLCDFGFARNLNPTSRSTALSSTMSAKQVKYEREARLLGVSTEQMSQFMMTTSSNNKSELQQLQQQQQQLLLLDNNKENRQSERQALTEYVATRWYRAPELLVGDVYYDKKIDIWAIGCVTAELMRGEPVWPGKTDLDQLCMIKNSLGALSAEQTHTLLSQGLYDQANIERLLSQASLLDPLERKLPARVGQAGFEFVLDCLQMEPIKRPACDELLQHQYIQSAQMSQFIQGASHTAIQNNPQADQQTVSFARESGKTNYSGLLGSSTDIRSLPHPATGMTRTNSQAILMIANNGNQLQQQQQQQQQPANKRLLITSEPRSGGLENNNNNNNNSANSQASPTKHSSLVPVPIRARQTDNIRNGQDASWPINQHYSTLQTNQNQQVAHHQYKRKAPQTTAVKSVVMGQQARGSMTISDNQKIRQANSKLNSEMGSKSKRSSLVLESAHRTNDPRKDGNRNTLNNELLVSQTRKSTKVVETARRDRLQTNLGHHSKQVGGSKKTPNSTRSLQLNTDSSASSSSPTSIGTSTNTLSKSHLPRLQN